MQKLIGVLFGSQVVLALGRNVTYATDPGTRLISTSPSHETRRTHYTREQTAQPDRCRAINVRLAEVSDG